MFYAHGRDRHATEPRIKLWERIKERSGREVEWLRSKPKIPESGVYIWNLYVEVKRGCDVLGINEIRAYSEMVSPISPFEAGVLLEIETLRRSNG